ncbi:MAG: hypothetical protein GXO32_05615 [Crenarchaeota archaeon]|nr:hypothetical protein [Thermoproteota archaeon]
MRLGLEPLIFLIIVLAIITAAVAIIAPSLVKYCAAGLLIIALIILMLHPSVVPQRIRERLSAPQTQAFSIASIPA